MKKEEIISAWAKIREENNSIPDDVLDFMKNSAIEKLSPASPCPPQGAEDVLRKVLCPTGNPDDGVLPLSFENAISSMQEYASLNQDGQDELWEEFVGEFNKAYASDLSLIDSFNKLKSLYHITKKQVR